jgi:hypothetical protein
MFLPAEKGMPGRHARGPRDRWDDAAGSALLISLLVMVVVTLLGITYLFQADTENQIAANERDRTQVLGVAEAGARMVKSWFDEPITGTIAAPSHRFMNTYDIRKKQYFDTAQRLINADGDPNTAPVGSAGVGLVYYKQGLTTGSSPSSDTDPNHALPLLQKPYRSNTTVTLMGTEAGPDLVISEASSSATVRAFLTGINAKLFSNPAQTGRITRIDIYEPPYVKIGTSFERYGVGTVKVTAAKFRPAAGGGEEKIAERVVKMVLNEAPYPGPGGPLESCHGLTITGSFEGHWGSVTAQNDVDLNISALNTKWDSAIPLADPSNYVPLPAYMTANGGGAGTVIEDPWLYIRTLGDYVGAPSTNQQAWPYNAGSYNPDTDHSNLIQRDTAVNCSEFPYDLWKQVARDGGGNVHYLTPAGGTTFKQNGVGVAQEFQTWVHNKSGLFFFDTTNGRAPDGTNLTPAVTLNGGWYSEGFIYANTQNFRTTGVSGVDIPIIAPGEPYADLFAGGAGYTKTYNREPFTDANANGIWDVGETFTDTIPVANGGTAGVYDAEPWVNIEYGTAMGGGGSPPDMRVKSVSGIDTATVTANGITATRTTTNARDADGLPVQAEVNLYGVLYNSGEFSAEGNGIYFGSVVTDGGVGEAFLGPGGAGNPTFYFDERLVKGEWPPPELDLPLTIISVWKTDY